MTQENPITPPDELVRQWARYQGYESPEVLWRTIATEAARWGADQQFQLDAERINQSWQKGADMELEACCAVVDAATVVPLEAGQWLRAARRRLKPLSLKELNLKHLEVMERDGHYLPEIISDLRRAIESLPE